MTDERDSLEVILDQALASYAEAEPLVGLEERIVSRIRPAAAPTGRRLKLAGALIACGLVGWVVSVWFVMPKAPTKPEVPILVAAKNSLPIELSVVRDEVKPSTPHRRLRRNLPKSSVFPIPSPLTKEEHLLLAMFRRNPEEAAQAFEPSPQWENRPLEIAPLAIPPLSIGSND